MKGTQAMADKAIRAHLLAEWCDTLANVYTNMTEVSAVLRALAMENVELREALKDIHKAKAPRKVSGYTDYKRLTNYMRGRARAARERAKP